MVGDLLQPRLAFEQIERGIGGGAAERVGHVARPVHQRLLGIVRPERVEHFFRRDGRRQRQRAAGERLRQRDDVGRDAGRLAGEHRAGAAEAGEHLVEDQQHVVFVGERAQALEHGCVVEFHAAGALHQRLDDNAGDGVGALGEQLVERRRLRIVVRQIDDVMLRQQAGEQRVHAAFGVAHRHGAGGVAVIAALEGDELPAPLHAAIDPVLRRHLERDFDRDRTGVGKEHAAEIARQQRGQPPRQRQRRLMRQPAEHHMRHLLELLGHRVPYVRLVIAVAGGPPAGDAVDQFAAVGQHDARALRAHHRQRRRCGLHLGIGQPDVLEAGRIPVGRFVFFAGIARHLALSYTRALARSIRARKARRFAAPPPAPGAGRDRARGRHLGRARRQAAAVVFLQRLSQPDPAPGHQASGHRRDREIRRRLRRLAPGHRQPPALRATGSAACPHQADRGRRGVRLRLSRQCRHHSGADRARRAGAGGRAVARLPVRRRAIVARQGDDVPPQRRRACARIAEPRIAPSTTTRSSSPTACSPWTAIWRRSPSCWRSPTSTTPG